MIIAIHYVLVGIELITNPKVASMVLRLLLAVGFILVGIFRIVMAVQTRGAAGLIWLFVGGIFSVLGMGLGVVPSQLLATNKNT